MKVSFFFKKAGMILLAAVLFAGMLSGCGTGGGTGSPGGTGNDSDGRLQVVTTIFPQYDFSRHIAGDYADVTMLLKPGEEVHSYEPTPQDIKMIQNCDLFIYTGGENDVWVESILASVGEEGPRAVRLLDLVDTYGEVQLEGMMPEKGGHDHEHSQEDESEEDHDHEHGAEEESEEDHDHEHGLEDEPEEGHDHEHGLEEESEEDHDHDHEHDDHDAHGPEEKQETEDHDHPETEEDHDHESAEDQNHKHEAGHTHGEEPDEHVWTSPENCVILIEKLTETFCEADPAHAGEYRTNGDAYRADFQQLDEEYRKMAEAAARKTILFGDRFPFRYLAEELELTCYAAFSGCSSESEPSAATIAFLIDKAAEENLPAVFKIEFSNGNIAQAICEAAQLRMDRVDQKTPDPGSTEQTARRMQVLQLHSCHNLTRDEFARGETCLSLMRRNLEALTSALN